MNGSNWIWGKELEQERDCGTEPGRFSALPGKNHTQLNRMRDSILVSVSTTEQ
jgi:hypothetical protein